MIDTVVQNTLLDRIFLISERITVFDGLQDVFGHIVKIAVQITSADAATIRLFDRKTGTLKIVKGYGVSTGFLSQPAVRMGQGITGRVVLEGKPFSTENVARVSHCVNKEFARLEGITSVLSVPLKTRDATIGCITVYRRKAEAFSEQDLIVLNIFAAQATEAVEKTQLVAELQKQAMFDSLTGVYNKGAVLRELASRLLLASRHKHQLSVIFLDLDNFKQFNELQGHLLGDKLLCDFAQILCRQCRKSDVVGRFGGEEFLIIAPNTSRRGAENMANKLLAATRQHRFSGTGGYVHITFSGGVAAYPQDGKDEQELLGRADKAMMHAKHSGKKKVCCWDRKMK